MKFIFKILIMTVLFSLNAFADNPDHYPNHINLLH